MRLRVHRKIMRLAGSNDLHHGVVYRATAGVGRQQFSGQMKLDVRLEKMQRGNNWRILEQRGDKLTYSQRVSLHLELIVRGGALHSIVKRRFRSNNLLRLLDRRIEVESELLNRLLGPRASRPLPSRSPTVREGLVFKRAAIAVSPP